MIQIGSIAISYRCISILIAIWFLCLAVFVCNIKKAEKASKLRDRLNMGNMSAATQYLLNKNKAKNNFGAFYDEHLNKAFKEGSFLNKISSILVPNTEQIAKNLNIINSTMRVEEFVAIKVIGLLAGTLMVILGLILNKNILLLVVGFICILVGALLENQVFGDKLKKRDKEINRNLPDFLNLLYSSCKAGHTTIESIQKVSEKYPGVLSEEFKLALIETKSNGGNLKEAINTLIARNENENFLSVLSDISISLEKGNSQIINTFKQESEIVRAQTKNRIEKEKNQKSTVLLFPMMIFFFAPALATPLIPLMYRFLAVLG